MIHGTRWATALAVATVAAIGLTGSAARAQSGLNIGYTWSSCHSTGLDLDHDGLHDFCENALAQAFAPGMQVQPDGIWDTGVTMNGVPFPQRLGGDYGFVVQHDPLGSGKVRIAYLPAYYYDQGDFGSNHSGDSEMILVDVSYNGSTGRWETQRVFLSAHCGTWFGGDCQWWDRSNFQWVGGIPWGAPVVWVSMLKHANFYSQARCQDLFGIPDECPSPLYYYRFPVDYSQQNLGSADYPLPWRSGGTPTNDCVPPFWTSGRLLQLNPAAYSGAYRECWWSLTSGGAATKFTGWLAPFGSLPGGYGPALKLYAGFDTGQSFFPPPTGGGTGNGVAVFGTTEAPSGTTCGYYVTVSGGTPPYFYQWEVNGLFTGDTANAINYENSGSSYSIAAIVTDAVGVIRAASLNVTTYSAPEGTVCLMVSP